ncbi:glucose-6-phosphate isomerase [Halocatena halophila]|uniref:glucose-6-phosphate isomerase n=1 Tax=Halocatena halophila TaxID=2814576 RepID=UPI002ED46A4C
MYVDIGNVLDSQPGLSRGALERLDERVADAHEHIEQELAAEGFGYRSLALGERTDPDRIASAVEPLTDCETVLTVGIGGSALGSATVTSALGVGENNPVCDNVDPQHLSSLLSSLSWDRTAVHVVSQSGTTAETLSNFLVVRDAMADAGVDWTEHTIVTTGVDGPLRALVDRHDLPSLSVPAGVPGRFSVLSTTSLVAPTILGCDVEVLLAGGRAARNSLSKSLFETPAYAYAAVAYALELRGANVNAFVPYAERLEPFAEWFAQLWAESLGKDGLGQTPVRALGATDQHSQLQLYRAGRHDKLVTLVRPRERPELTIPSTAIDELSYLGGTGVGELLDAEFEATEASLAAADQPNVRLEIDALDAYSLGELLVSMEAATIMAGELLNVDTFTQPAVEWGKRAARGLLGANDAPEADAITEKRSLTIESP